MQLILEYQFILKVQRNSKHRSLNTKSIKLSSFLYRYYYCCCENVTPIDTFNQMIKLGQLEEDIFQEQLKMFVGILKGKASVIIQYPFLWFDKGSYI